jgi:hypothetical protein
VHRRRPAGVNQNARCAIAWRAGRDPLPSLRQVASRFPLRALCVQTGGHDSREVGLTDRCRFGLIFVLANTGALQPGLGTVLRVFGVAAFVAVLVALRRPAAVTRPAGSGIGRGYWLVVACEVIVITVGLVLLNGPLHAPQAAVSWISFVVGAHFIGLSEASYQAPCSSRSACGAAREVLTPTRPARRHLDDSQILI